MTDEPRLGWVVALGCEAHPIREQLALRPVDRSGPFPVYASECKRHWLVRSGVGRTNAAAATMYLHQLLGGVGHIAWLNVGVAGHRDLPLGTARRVHQIHEASTARRFYPTQVFTSPFKGASLMTVDQPQAVMSDDHLYDMEGSAVFELASRLSSQELVSVVKCVSDHGADGSTWPDKAVVSQWIADQMPGLLSTADGLLEVSMAESARLAPALQPSVFDHIHFTVTQQHQLRRLLQRWQVLRPTESIEAFVSADQSARQVITALRQTLDEQLIDWTVL